MGDSRTTADPPPSASLTRGADSASLLRRLSITGLFVAASAVFVVTLRLWCVVFAGLLLGVFLHRISQAISRRTPLGYRVAVACVLVAGVLLSISTVYLVVPRFGAQLGDLSSTLTAAAESMLERVSQWGWMDNVTSQAPDVGGRLLSGLDTTAILGGVFSSITGTATAILLILFVGVCFTLDPDLYCHGFLLLFPPDRRKRAAEVLTTCLDTLWWWTMGRLFAMAVIAVATSLGLWLLGVPMPFTLGAIAGLISFVPTIGAVLAILPALLVAFQQAPWTPVYVLILYVAIQAVENNILTPLVQQRAVSIPPIVLVVSQVLMGILVGIVGVAIATPLASVVLQLVRELYVQEPDAVSIDSNSVESK